jgi:hypothetical protein
MSPTTPHLKSAISQYYQNFTLPPYLFLQKTIEHGEQRRSHAHILKVFRSIRWGGGGGREERRHKL